MFFSDDSEDTSSYRKENKLKAKSRKIINKNVPKPERHGSPEASVRSLCSFNMDRRGVCEDDCDSEPDRSNPLWKITPVEEEEDESRKDTETEPETPSKNLWDEIITEYEDRRLEYETLVEISKPYEPPTPVCFKISAAKYLEENIFPLLCPALEETLHKAKESECLMIQKCRFNGLDYIAELLWNRNPMYPSRQDQYLEIFDIPFAIIWLYYNPRPIFPLSWLWSKEEAIIVMQTYIRRYNVCKEAECSEMRRFWKTLKSEKEKQEEARRQASLEQMEILFNYIFDKLIADAVFEVEWKINGCRCVQKPCHCVCKCMKWCKCCNCYKVPAHEPQPCDCGNLVSNRDE